MTDAPEQQLNFAPAVPLPVLPPSDVGKQAIAELKLKTPGQVAARVAATERESAELRKMREGDL